MYKAIKSILSVILFSIIVLVGMVVLLVFDRTYDTYRYVVDSVYESKDQEKIWSRFYEIQYENFNFNIEWYTYDNKDITRGPYKLYMVVEPKSNIEYIKVNNLKITSSMNNIYSFDKINNWPVEIYRFQNEYTRQSFQFEDIFDFNFRKKETIILEFEIIYKINWMVEKQEYIRLKFVPVIVEEWDSLV